MTNSAKMTSLGAFLKGVAMAGIGVGLAACGPQKVAQAPAAVPAVAVPQQAPAPIFVATSGLTPSARLKKAVNLLSTGQEGQARAEIQELLVDNPNGETAKSILDQIDRDPKELFGMQSFAYTLKPGETLSIIADRYLNDRYKFWGLAKYNNITNPAGVSVGQAIQIPGLPRTVVVRASRNDDDEINDRLKKEAAAKAAAAKAAAAKNDPPTPPATTTPPPVVIAANPERAKSFRKAGLEYLQRGNVDKAIYAFNQAMQFAKGTALLTTLSQDLQRAQKIKANMKK
jgi:tetratricopeptide (TPR) repeat protein